MDFYAILNQVIALLRQRQLVPHRRLELACSVQTGREQARPVLATAIAPYHVMDMAFWLPLAEAALA